MQTTDHDNSDPIHLQQLLEKGTIGKIVSKVALLNQLNKTLNEALCQQSMPPCHVSNIEFNTLTLSCNNQATAHRLHYQQQAILTAINSAYPDISIAKIKVKVTRY